MSGINDAKAELRRSWRHNWLRSIAEFADRDLQLRTWLDPQQTNPHRSYVEFMCSYFDDLGLSAGYADVIDRGLVTHAEADILVSLHEMLGRHGAPGGNDYDHAAILRDPAWSLIIEEAAKAKRRLSESLHDPQERQWLADNGESFR